MWQWDIEAVYRGKKQNNNPVTYFLSLEKVFLKLLKSNSPELLSCYYSTASKHTLTMYVRVYPQNQVFRLHDLAKILFQKPTTSAPPETYFYSILPRCKVYLIEPQQRQTVSTMQSPNKGVFPQQATVPTPFWG